jgi:hypothetical protein
MADTPARPQTAKNKLPGALFPNRRQATRRALARHPAEIIAACMLLLMGANLLSVAAHKSVTTDELVHIPSGYQSLVAGNFNLNPEHPPLTKMLACLPLLVIRPETGEVIEPPQYDFAEHTLATAIHFWRENRPHFRLISFWARVPMVLLTLSLGSLIFVYARQLFGARAAVFSVLLFSLEPTMLAHGWIVHTDIAAALGYLLFVFALQKYCGAPTMARALFLGGATGFALLTKFSLVIVIPVLLGGVAYAIALARPLRVSRRRVILQAGLALAAPLCLINAAYFRHGRLGVWAADWIFSTMPNAVAAGRTIAAINLFSRIVPTQYLVGIYTVYLHNHYGHHASLLGRHSAFGWWYYFPVAFALKTSLPFLLLTVVTICWAVWAAVFRREKKLVLPLLAIALYLGFSMTSNINIGIRHIAPVFPFLFLLGGASLDRFLKQRRATAARALVVILLAWMVVGAVRAYPDYLSFTNSLTFGKPGWAVLSDSNVEWGQDIGALAEYLHNRGETKLVGSLSASMATPEMYDIQLLDFAPPDLESASTRYVAIGAGFLNGSTMAPGFKDAEGNVLSDEQRDNYFAKYRTLHPEKVFGNSIYLYRKRE